MAKSFLEMSDEELANVDISTIDQVQDSDPVEEEPVDEGDTEAEAQAESEGGDESDTEETTEAETEEDSSEEATDTEPDVAEESADGNEESNPKADTAATGEVDYKAVYEKITAPFKANGRDIQVGGVEDAIALMQMGANYNKKMAALKPNLKMLKLLENNGLLSEEKLAFLIDLNKKNPEAITKLVKDSGLDPLEMDTDSADAYQPKVQRIDDREIELDAVLDEIQDTPTYTQTLDIVSNKWDASSRQVIADSPQLLKVINSHVNSGIYDAITRTIENERVFGRLQGLSDIEAYRQVGDAIQARGGFDHLINQGQQIQPKPVVVKPKPKMGDEGNRREKKLAASPSKSGTPPQQTSEFNPLALSDEEFNKIVNQRFL